MSRAEAGDPSVPVPITSEMTRVITSGAIGVIVAAVLAAFSPWQISVLSGWIVASATFATRVWRRINRLDATRTAAVATREDGSRAAAHIMVNGASVVSLVGVAVTLARASKSAGDTRLIFTLAAILTLLTSWVLVQTVFTLRYAHAYYGVPIGGIDFNTGAEDPDYHDFAYLAFTIGMTFQVADTDLTTNALRRLTLRHALLSYLFGAVILATAINVTASFIL